MDDEFISLGEVELLIKPSNGRIYVRKTRFSHYVIKSLARFVYERLFSKLPENYEIHHKDLNPFNNNISNLIPVKRKDHKEIHARVSLKRLHDYLLSEMRFFGD